MYLYFSPRIPISRQLAEQLKKQILTGVLQTGEKLPSVREMAKTMAVNPNTVAKVYSELEEEGYLRNEAGKGCFVTDTAQSVIQIQNEYLSEFYRQGERCIRTGITVEQLRERIDLLSDSMQSAGRMKEAR